MLAHDGPVILSAYLVTVSVYAGFQWTVRIVVYPALADVPAPAFVAYLTAYQRRVTYLVGPLFAALLLTTALLATQGSIPIGARGLALALLAVILATTAFLAVPAHRTLSKGWDVGAHRYLLRADAVRVAAATAQAGLALALVLASP